MTRPRIEVEGARELRRQLDELANETGEGSAELRDLLRYAAEPVFAEAERRVPKRSGALKASLRVTGGRSSAFIRAGFARVYYARFVHDGTRYLKARPFLEDAVEDRRVAAEVVARLEQGLDDLIEETIK